MAALSRVEETIGRNTPGRKVDEAIAWAERLLTRATGAGAHGSELKRLQGRLDDLKGFAQSRMRDNVVGPAPLRSAHTK